MQTTDLATLTAERDALTAQIAATLDPTTKRSLAARKAHLTRKINKLRTEQFAPVPAAPTVTLDATAPLPPEQILAETRAMLAEHDLEGWTASLSNIMTKTYGCCDYRKREIRIAARVAALNPAADTRDTIAHEVAHALAGPRAGHGPVWKRACGITGARPVACHAAEVVETPVRYRGICEACGEDVGGRKVAPRRGQTHRHRPSRCSAATPGQIRWVDTRR